MEKVIFIDMSGNDLLTTKDLKDFRVPSIKDEIVWMKLCMTVERVVHNYDKKEIHIWVEVE
jgi:hypothetical protein